MFSKQHLMLLLDQYNQPHSEIPLLKNANPRLSPAGQNFLPDDITRREHMMTTAITWTNRIISKSKSNPQKGAQ